MPRIVISVLSIVWMILSGSSLLIIVASLFTTGWLRRLESDSSRWQMECDSIFYNPLSSGSKVKQVSYREVGEDFSDVDNYQPPSIGPFFRCYTPCQDEKSVWSFQWPSTGRTHVFCQIALWGGGQNPANSNAVTWTATILILCGVVALLLATSLLCASLCRRDILGRSTFQLTGVFQCVAARCCDKVEKTRGGSDAGEWRGMCQLFSVTASSMTYALHSFSSHVISAAWNTFGTLTHMLTILPYYIDLMLLTGLFLWPAGWDSVPIHEICGASTASYRKGSCEFTEGPIVALFGVCLLFISAALSTLADRSIARHPVNRQMLINGKNFMFV
ncbi:unnamed protein product [Schistocephalus solidus]|uniref:Lipoma HMGIC fusion partner-like protein n=1 Tax=Schistocephalus solidus TaxID=70667 RepID=A0A183SKI1_SCHSO|nr:unnamed protein product [Schistocephalus solidus]